MTEKNKSTSIGTVESNEFLVLKQDFEIIVSIGPNPTRDDFQRALEQLMSKISEQEEVIIKEQEYLQRLQDVINIVKAEMEK